MTRVIQEICMRTVMILCVALIAGCATSAKAPPEEREVPIDASNIVPAQQAGYKIVNKDGEKLYCKKTLNTGSHLRTTTTCLSEKEWEQLQDASRQSVEAMRRTAPPPHGT
jgi:hypothetical protein